MEESSPQPLLPSPSQSISSALALQIRLSQLQSLVGHVSPPPPTASQPLLLRALSVQRALEASIASHSSLRKFAKVFDTNRRILEAGFRYDARSFPDTSRMTLFPTLDALGSGEADGGDQVHRRGEPVLTTQEQILLVLDSEKDIRSLERLLTECEALDKRGVSGPGKMAEYEHLQPLLNQCLQRHTADLAPSKVELEDTLLGLLERYHFQVDSLSRLFISWDEALKEMEDKVGAMETAKRRRGE